MIRSWTGCARNFPTGTRSIIATSARSIRPAAELLFAGLSRISESPLLYKLLFAAADLATAAVLLRLIGGASRYANASWYAWNPLVVYCFAGGAHFDSLMILPMLAGILCLTRFETATASRTKWLLALSAATLFGLAISVKLIPLLLLPLCVFALGYRAITLAVSLAIPALLSVLYGFPHVPHLGIAHTLRARHPPERLVLVDHRRNRLA